MTQLLTNKNLSKLPKLKKLLENLKCPKDTFWDFSLENHKTFENVSHFVLFSRKNKNTLNLPKKNVGSFFDKKNLMDTKKKFSQKSREKDNLFQNSLLEWSKNFSLYSSLTEKPLNLLFSMDQFFFEFSKKNYQQKKSGEFLRQLKERKKLSYFYGDFTLKQLTNFFHQAKKTRGNLSLNVFSLLERKLDVVLYRSGLAKTVAQARQLIKHKKILVNQNQVDIPSFLVNPGDFISIKPGHVMSFHSAQKTWIKNLLTTLDSPSNKPVDMNGSAKNSFFAPSHFLVENFWLFFPEKKKAFFQNFFPKFRKSLDHSASKNPPLRTRLSGFKEIKKKPFFHQTHFLKCNQHPPFKEICHFLTKTLCSKIKLRCDFHLQTSFAFQKGSSSNFLSSDFLSDFQKSSEKTVFLVLKRKFFLTQKISVKNKNHHFPSASPGSLHKKPQFCKARLAPFWAQNRTTEISPSKGHLFNQTNLDTQDSYLNQKKKFKKSNPLFFRKKKTLQKKSLQIFCTSLEKHTGFAHFLVLNLQNSFFRNKHHLRFSKSLDFRVFKPLHLEVSYAVYSLVYLYSPQKLNFPFSIDVDLISRSLR